MPESNLSSIFGGDSSSKASALTMSIQHVPEDVDSFHWGNLATVEDDVGYSFSYNDDEQDEHEVTPCSFEPPCFASPCEQLSMPSKTSGMLLSCSPDSVMDAPLTFRPRPRVRVADRIPSRITFNEKVSVRVHNVVASNHPCCKSGLAFELGWDYNESEIELRSCGLRRLRRRSHAERRSFLAEVSEYTNQQLDEQLVGPSKTALWSTGCHEQYQKQRQRRRAARRLA